MSILLLGATGFVGKNVAKVFDENKIHYHSNSLSLGCDLRDLTKTVKTINEINPKIVINCAAHVGSLNYVTEMAADVIADNGQMIINIYKALAELSNDIIIINPIANCAYPAKAEVYNEDNLWEGQMHRSVLSYGASRRFLWAVGESYAMQYGIRTVNLLVPNMYGPFDSTDPNKAHALNALVSRFVKAEKEQQSEITLWGTGIAIREWLYAEDFGRIILQIINNSDMLGLDEPVNIAQNFGLSVKELSRIITKHFNFSGQIKWDSTKPDGALKKVMDDRRFLKVFPDFKFTTLDDGIKATISYYNSIYPY